ncbi:MAG: hypothetical protein K0Q73_8953 [Paenibacillus sp.]|nr:hypothetical protein [Paenibacillus sp.]
MKLKVVFLLTTILSIALLISCSNSKMITNNTLHGTSWLTKLSLDHKDYELFNTYFTDPRKNKISKEQFEELSKLTTAAWSHDYYSLITFSNGEMVLINVVEDLENEGYYKVQDIKQVPEEMKRLFFKK